jgi:hypothetical protein
MMNEEEPMHEGEPAPAAAPLVCARCRRPPRDPDDRARWVTIDDHKLCPGCLTLAEFERVRGDRAD